MAIVQNFWLKGASKRLAGAVIYEAMGQTRARQLATSVTNPRTLSQMNQRVKWANLVNLYRANASWMKYAFETKSTNQSEYNKFMSLNVTGSRIYLTKQIAAAGGAVVDAYTITQGSLPSIEWNNVSEGYVSNIFVGPDFDFSSNKTVGDFAAVLKTYNPAIREGDQISFIRMTQLVNPITAAPYVVVRKYEVLISSDSTVLLSKMLPVDVLSIVSVGTDRAVSVRSYGKSGGFAIILSRTVGGKTHVSTQNITLVNMADFITAYSSPEALDAAIRSYGESSDAFLSSNTAYEAADAPISLSILGRIMQSGELAPSMTLTRQASIFAGQANSYKFNGSLLGMVISSVKLFLTDGSEYEATYEVSETDSSLLVVTFPTEGLSDNPILADYIQFVIDNVEYRYNYIVNYEPGGME